MAAVKLSEAQRGERRAAELENRTLLVADFAVLFRDAVEPRLGVTLAHLKELEARARSPGALREALSGHGVQGPCRRRSPREHSDGSQWALIALARADNNATTYGESPVHRVRTVFAVVAVTGVLALSESRLPAAHRQLSVYEP